jgi:anti-sigma regulatory factor (Ser/Thr protein kinase)
MPDDPHHETAEAVTADEVADVLAEAARRLHGETDLRRLLRWAIDAVTRLSSATADVALVNRGGMATWTLAEPDPDRDEPTSADLGAVPGLRWALVDGRTIEVDGRTVGLDPGVVAAVPIMGAQGSIHGLVFLRPPERALSRPVQALIEHLGAALDTHARAIELEASRGELVHRLQEAVLPPAPEIADTELARHYSGAESALSTGGDLYDWLALPDGDLHVCVVDIMGKGVDATKDAIAVTHTIRMLTLDGCPLEDVVGRADAILANQNPDLAATLVVARYDPATGRARVAGGGHPPPLLVRSSGEVEQVEAPGIAIGWPGAGSYGVTEIHLDRNESLLLYTDGLIESTRDILEGLDRLAKYAAETATYPATHQARALVDRVLAGAERRDDSLVVILRRRSPPMATSSHQLAPFEYRFTPTTAAVSLARHLLSDWLTRFPVPADETGDLLLVASELISNAVRHATGSEGSTVLRAWAEDADVVIEVEDDGAGPSAWPVPDDEPPPPDLERGRGLFLVHALSDAVEMESDSHRTAVRCRKRAILSAR